MDNTLFARASHTQEVLTTFLFFPPPFSSTLTNLNVSTFANPSRELRAFLHSFSYKQLY